jgi:hypothetical protein
MKALFHFDVELDIGESYLYGTAAEDDGRRGFAINLQGGSTEVVLPTELLAGLPYASKTRLNIRTEFETIIMDAKLSPSGRNMIEIYDDALLQRLANARYVALQIEIN